MNWPCLLWETFLNMENSREKIKRHKTSRMEICVELKPVAAVRVIGWNLKIILLVDMSKFFPCNRHSTWVFCWNEKLIARQDLLKILKGDALHIAATTTYFSKEQLRKKRLYCQHQSNEYNITRMKELMKLQQKWWRSAGKRLASTTIFPQNKRSWTMPKLFCRLFSFLFV